ncbi:MAG: DUF3047 domain-containing protein [Thermodesulfovibrionales bacterium]|nr:DUF3047 domain-containing protein [Thermodesulfovibrionales bacterium]
MRKYLQICAVGIIFLVLTGIFFVKLSLADTQSIIFDFDGRVNSEGVASTWELKEKSGAADVKIVSDSGEKVVQLKSDNASFSIEREVNVNIKNYPYLAWRWKASKLPPRGDVRSGKTNDQALQLLVAFEGRKILSYTWDSNAPEGTVTEESVAWPVSLKIKIITVKSGTADIGKWLTITRNVYDDYRKFFKEEPPHVKGIRIQTNSQHTESIGEGL